MQHLVIHASHHPACAFCGDNAAVTSHRGLPICGPCFQDLSSLRAERGAETVFEQVARICSLYFVADPAAAQKGGAR